MINQTFYEALIKRKLVLEANLRELEAIKDFPADEAVIAVHENKRENMKNNIMVQRCIISDYLRAHEGTKEE